MGTNVRACAALAVPVGTGYVVIAVGTEGAMNTTNAAVEKFGRATVSLHGSITSTVTVMEVIHVVCSEAKCMC